MATQLDLQQIFQHLYDTDNHRLNANILLPEHASTDILQITGNNSLTLINNKLNTVDSFNHSLDINNSGSYVHISTNTTTFIKNGPGILLSVILNTLGSNNNIATLYDSLTGSGNKIAIIDLSKMNYLIYGIRFLIGLTIVTSGGNSNSLADITISYK